MGGGKEGDKRGGWKGARGRALANRVQEDVEGGPGQHGEVRVLPGQVPGPPGREQLRRHCAVLELRGQERLEGPPRALRVQEAQAERRHQRSCPRQANRGDSGRASCAGFVCVMPSVAEGAGWQREGEGCTCRQGNIGREEGRAAGERKREREEEGTRGEGGGGGERKEGAMCMWGEEGREGCRWGMERGIARDVGGARGGDGRQGGEGEEGRAVQGRREGWKLGEEVRTRGSREVLRDPRRDVPVVARVDLHDVPELHREPRAPCALPLRHPFRCAPLLFAPRRRRSRPKPPLRSSQLEEQQQGRRHWSVLSLSLSSTLPRSRAALSLRECALAGSHRVLDVAE